MPAAKDSIPYPMRFSKKDKPLYEQSVLHAESMRMSLAELIRRCLLRELEEAGKWPVKG